VFLQTVLACVSFGRLERRGRFGPQAGKLEILLTPSGIDRQLGRPNAVLGVAIVQLLECRQIFGVLLLIESSVPVSSSVF
jgi:hypothetical protein